MNRWARRHRAALEADLDEGERLLAALNVTVKGYRAVSPLPIPGRMFAIGVSDRRVLLYRTSRWLAHPVALAFDVPLGAVANIVATTRLTGRRLAVQVGADTLHLGALAPFASVKPIATAFAAARTGTPT